MRDILAHLDVQRLIGDDALEPTTHRLQLRPTVNCAQHANDLLVREPRFPQKSSRLPGSDPHIVRTSGRGERRLIHCIVPEYQPNETRAA